MYYKAHSLSTTQQELTHFLICAFLHYLFRRLLIGNDFLEHVEFTVEIEDGEEFIVNRLEREKRVGTVEKLDEKTYRFSADVFDASEMIPWIRTFICRIVKLNFSNRTIENRFKHDLEEMYRMYGIGEEGDQ